MAGLFIARMANHPVGGETWLNKSLSRGMCFSTDTAMVCVRGDDPQNQHL